MIQASTPWHFTACLLSSKTFLLWQRNPELKHVFNIHTVKFRKIAPGLIFFKGPFWGAYVRRDVCVSKSIGLACSWKEIYRLCFALLCIRGQFPSTRPRGAYIGRGDFTEGFLCYEFGVLILGGDYTWRGLFSEFYGIYHMLNFSTPWRGLRKLDETRRRILNKSYSYLRVLLTRLVEKKLRKPATPFAYSLSFAFYLHQ